MVEEMVRQHSSSWLLISRQIGGRLIIASLNQSDAEYIQLRVFEPEVNLFQKSEELRE